MCGIVGLVGNAPVEERLMEALKRLEYRGYDSAGLAAVQPDGHLERRRAVGKLSALKEVLDQNPLAGHTGIGHTRWATHGQPTKTNAHPHMTDRIALVHNGIIENFRDLREELAGADIVCEGETDTEVITRLIDRALAEGQNPFEAFKTVLQRLEGAFALAVVIRGDANIMFGARRGSPLVVGLGDGEMMLGSDAIALAPMTSRLIYLDEGDMVALTRDEARIFDSTGQPVERTVVTSRASATLVDKGGYRHFMLKEIFEQPTVVAQTLGTYMDAGAGTVRLPDLPVDLTGVSRVTFIACGTAYYAGSVGRYWCEQIAGVPADDDIASEFRYRSPVLDPSGLAVFVSQSGETADSLAALRLAKELGQKTLAIVNVPESSMAREADAVLLTHAGPEIGVASTKAFTCQLAVLAAFCLALARAKGRLTADAELEHVQTLAHLPSQIAEVLAHSEKLQGIAGTLKHARDTLFVGRGAHFPIALEGALKLKEISYIHAEGYAAGELKHGPIALVDENVPTIGLAPSHDLYAKTISNLEEIEARKGRVILVSDTDRGHSHDDFIPMPEGGVLTSPILYALPVQLIAYYAAIAKGTDVDQPRNLAKSVTVE